MWFGKRKVSAEQLGDVLALLIAPAPGLIQRGRAQSISLNLDPRLREVEDLMLSIFACFCAVSEAFGDTGVSLRTQHRLLETLDHDGGNLAPPQSIRNWFDDRYNEYRAALQEPSPSIAFLAIGRIYAARLAQPECFPVIAGGTACFQTKLAAIREFIADYTKRHTVA